MNDLGLMSYFSCMEVHQTHDEIFLYQAKYVRENLKKFGMSECKPIATPISHGELLCFHNGAEKVCKIEHRSIVWSLMFLCYKRLDICYIVSLYSRYMDYPSYLHLKEAKIILRYVYGTINYGIHYFSHDNLKLIFFSESD